MNALETFSNREFGEIRTVTINGEPWFIAKDVAAALGYKKLDAMYRIIDEEDKREINPQSVVNTGFPQNRGNAPINPNIKRMTLLNESGMYEAVFNSSLPTAKQFKKWVTSEVLPSIRKNGGYIYGQETLTDDELIIRALQVANNKIGTRNAVIEQQTHKIKELEQKAAYAEAIAASDTSILVREFAHILRQNGINTGEKRLFKWFRDKGYIYRNSTEPTQRALDLELFEVQQYTIKTGKGEKVTRTTRVTGKGQVYFTDKLLNSKGAHTDKVVTLHV